MAFVDIILSIVLFLWDLFKQWIELFISPFYNLEMLWIIIPIWINWFFADLYQEKKGTSLGNAITNGAVMTWVGIDWIRHLINLIDIGRIPGFHYVTIIKFLLAITVGCIGIFIVKEGIQKKEYIHFIGRVRETTYITAMISPIIYGAIELSWSLIFAIILFAPLFYYSIELIMRFLPQQEFEEY